MLDYQRQPQEVARCTGMGAQHATFSQPDTTDCATPTQQMSLKTLSLLALQRNQARNSRATNDATARNSNPEKTPEKLHEVAGVSAWLESIGETDEATIADVRDRCSADPDALAYYLTRVEGREPTAPAVKPDPDDNAELWVLCWTPTGSPMRIQARDAAHAEWLQRMNSPPAKAGKEQAAHG